MRTINHTGATSPFNFTVIAPDEYTYIFSPNFFEITLGAGYAATQEVSIACNGITLKRNCIDRYCRFDLSSIFESFFADSDFAIDYDNVAADPFFAGSKTITITADTGETEDVDFDLRWGVFQFDEPEPVTLIGQWFPFWANMPLVLNTWQHHDIVDIADDNYTSPTKTYPVDEDADFVFTSSINEGGSPQTYSIVEQIYFKLQTCPTDGHYISWIDMHGQIRHYMFERNRNNEITTDIKTDNELPLYPISLDDSINGRIKTVSKSKQRKFTAFASVDSDIFDIVASIAASPIVRYYANEKWISVTISDMTITKSDRWTQDIQFEVLLPADYIQKR